MSDVTIGIDIGTTSVKAVAVDGSGTVLARTRVPHTLRFPSANRMEHDAAEAWHAGPGTALHEIGTDGVAGIAVAAMVPSLAAVDGDGVPTTPGLLYGDERGRAHLTNGPAGATGEAIGFLEWTAAEAPAAHGYWTAQAVANHALAGEAVMDSAGAASTYPLFDGTRWDPDHLARAGATDAQMPRVAGLGEPIGKVGDAVLASGLVDAVGEGLVAGAAEEGDVLVLIGSTLMTWAVVTEWRPVDGLWCIPHSVAGRFLIGGASNAGGIFVGWADRLTGEVEGGGEPEPGNVPVWAPYPRGERVPLHDPSRRALLDGLNVTHGPAAVRRATHEASGFVVRHTFERAGLSPTRIIATGGGVRVPEWVQAIADATGLPVDLAAVPEGGALGAAFVARVAAGLETDLMDGARWAATSGRVEPDPAWTEPAAARYARFLELTGE